MIDRIYRITVVGDSSWRVERPVSHPNPNSLNSVNTVSKAKERICTELESSMGVTNCKFQVKFSGVVQVRKTPEYISRQVREVVFSGRFANLAY